MGDVPFVQGGAIRVVVVWVVEVIWAGWEQRVRVIREGSVGKPAPEIVIGKPPFEPPLLGFSEISLRS